MVLIEVESKEKYAISSFLRNGENYLICPVCAKDRKKSKEKKLMVNGDKGAGQCHHCGSRFVVENKNFMPVQKIEKIYQKPIWKNKTDLSDLMVKYWEGRKISQNTLLSMRVTEGLEWMPDPHNKEVNTVQFNYFRDGELINVKYRTGDKKFKLFKDAELILYNLDAIKDSEECLICEGEPDCLSWVESGYKFAVSVPNGANKTTQNLQYIDNCYDYFENKTKIYISYDNDPAGVALRNELIRRLGEERCFLIDLDGQKDANDYMKAYGGQSLLEKIKLAREVPVEGIFSVEDFETDLDVLYNEGLSRGCKINLPNMDELIGWETSRLLVATGIPGHGKSEVVDEIVSRLNLIHGWKAAYFSPENFPLTYHASKMTERLIGSKMNREKMPIEDYVSAKTYLNENYRFIMPDDDEFSLDNVLEKARILIKRIGIRILIIDPWNRLEYQLEKGETETKYIARQLVKMTNFAKRNNILLILVAHPVKMQKNASGGYEIPTLYSVSGSANFFNMADYGICVYREEGKVSVFVQKVKFKHLGTTGCAEFYYNINNGRYTPYDECNQPQWDNSSYLKKSIHEINNRYEVDRVDDEYMPSAMPVNTVFYNKETDIPF